MQRFDPALALMTDDEILAEIEALRAKNNTRFMDMHRLLLRVAPREARQIIADILANDARITELDKRLVAHGNSW